MYPYCPNLCVLRSWKQMKKFSVELPSAFFVIIKKILICPCSCSKCVLFHYHKSEFQQTKNIWNLCVLTSSTFMHSLTIRLDFYGFSLAFFCQDGTCFFSQPSLVPLSLPWSPPFPSPLGHLAPSISPTFCIFIYFISFSSSHTFIHIYANILTQKQYLFLNNVYKVLYSFLFFQKYFDDNFISDDNRWFFNHLIQMLLLSLLPSWSFYIVWHSWLHLIWGNSLILWFLCHSIYSFVSFSFS